LGPSDEDGLEAFDEPGVKNDTVWNHTFPHVMVGDTTMVWQKEEVITTAKCIGFIAS